MKLSKSEGLKMLKLLGLPTIEQIDPNLLDENSEILKQGLSVRTSPKKDLPDNVYLPSIHNCTDLNELRTFIREHQSEYHIIVHKTITSQIGSVSRYEAGTEKVIIENFEDFDKRKKGIIKNRMIVPILGERFMVNDLQLQETNEQDFKLFSKVLREVKYMPFKKFDMEFVAEDGKILFTDLTINSRPDSIYAEELAKKAQAKENKKSNTEAEKSL